VSRRPRVVCCRKVGVRRLVLFSPTRFHTEDLGPRLLRLSPVQSQSEQNARALRETPCKIYAFPHGQGVGGGIEVMDTVLFRAIMAMGCIWGITRVRHVAAEENAHVLALV
jgi:hypothetical protein